MSTNQGMGMRGGGGGAGGAYRKPPKDAIQLTKSPIKHYLKTVYKTISKSRFFYCHTYEFDLVVRLRDRLVEVVHTLLMGVLLAYVLH